MASRILLADDSITIQKVVNLTFADEGIEVISVSNGDAAERRLPDVDPDLVLADIFMPGKNGYELCETIKAHPQFKGLPVVLLVGAFEPFNEAEARRVKADGHLTKPFESRVLVEMVRNLIVNHPRPRQAAPAAPSASQPAAVTQPFSPILRPEATLDFAAMGRQVAPEPVPDPPVYFQDETVIATPAMEQADQSRSVEQTGDSQIDFTTPGFVEDSAPARLSSFSNAHNQLKPALPDSEENQAHWSFNTAADVEVDYEKVEASEAPDDDRLAALEVDSVPDDEPAAEPAAEAAAASTQQAFIAILSEPSAPETSEEDDDKPKKFDTSELPSPDSEEGVKKFDTNELEPPPASETAETASPAPPATASFGFDGDTNDEPLGDVLDEAISLDGYAATEEQSPLEIEEPALAPPLPTYTEAQIAGSPHSVDAFVDVTAPASQDMASPSDDSAPATGFAFVDAPPSEAETISGEATTEAAESVAATAESVAPDSGFALVTDDAPAAEAVSELAVQAAEPSEPAAESPVAASEMWSIGLPTETPSADYAPAALGEETAASSEAAAPVAAASPEAAPAGPTPTAAPLEASQEVIDEIVRRVVAQLSDTVVREIAWEVVPECVERVVTNLTKEKMGQRS